MRFPFSLAAGILLLGLCLASTTSLHAAGQTNAPQPSAVTVVKDYFAVLDSDLKSAAFANLGIAYAPTATLKVVDMNGIAVEYHGLAAITRYWTQRRLQVPGLHFAPDSIVLLDIHHVTAFERTSTAMKPGLAGRCAHLFKVIRGKIVFDSYFPAAFTKAELAQK